MSAKIFCKTGELRGLSAEIGDEAVLGRSRKATIPIQAELISAEHVRIHYDGESGAYVLEDLGSTNGTELDGIKVRRSERLGHLHVITLAGSYDLIFQDLGLCAERHGSAKAAPIPAPAPSAIPPPDAGAAKPGEGTQIDDLPPVMPPALADSDRPGEGTRIDDMPPILPPRLAEPDAAEPSPDITGVADSPIGLPSVLAQKADAIGGGTPANGAAATVPLPPMTFDTTTPAEPPPAEAAASAPPSARLVLEIHAKEGVLRFPLRDGEHVIGRAQDADVKLDTLDVSRRHAVLTLTGRRVTVRDLGSSNHTYLEGVMLAEATEVPLGGKLRFGSLAARVIPAGDEPQP